MKSLSVPCLIIWYIFVIVASEKKTIVRSESTNISDQNSSTESKVVSETSTVHGFKVETNGTSPQFEVGSIEESTVSTIIKSRTGTDNTVKPYTVLEYVPITSFYHPRPVTVGQIISPGTPWPDSPTSVKPIKQSTPQTTFPPNLVDRFPELTTLNKRPTTTKGTKRTTATKASKRTTRTTTTTESYVKPQTVLEYVPITSFHHPNPVTPAQIIPPGKPWPASPGEHQTESSLQTSTLVNLNERLPDVVTTTVKHTKLPDLDILHTSTKPTTLEHKDTRPPEILTTRIPSSSKKTNPSFNLPTSSPTHLILTYKPSRPWYIQRPGSNINQIIPPGKPWPASAEEYSTFSVTTHSPWFKDVSENFSHSKLDNFQLSKSDAIGVEPNALQYYGSRITAPSKRVTPVTPYTSGTQKTTLSDIVDILKEVHNISLVSGNSPPKPSHLLPFDADKGHPLNYSIRSPNSQYEKVTTTARVYDGIITANDPTKNERIFVNPKFDKNNK